MNLDSRRVSDNSDVNDMELIVNYPVDNIIPKMIERSTNFILKTLRY